MFAALASPAKSLGLADFFLAVVWIEFAPQRLGRERTYVA